MKKFLKNLGIGLAVAVAAALAACFTVWSLHSLHRLVWFGICVIICLIVGQYLANPDYTYTQEDGQWHKVSKIRQICAVAGILIALGILGSLLWAIGYWIASLFGWHPDLWETYLLYGGLAVAAVIIAFIAVFRFWFFCDDLYHNRYGVRDYAKNLVMWIFITLCGAAVAGTILYYVFPLALRH